VEERDPQVGVDKDLAGARLRLSNNNPPQKADDPAMKLRRSMRSILRRRPVENPLSLLQASRLLVRNAKLGPSMQFRKIIPLAELRRELKNLRPLKPATAFAVVSDKKKKAGQPFSLLFLTDDHIRGVYREDPLASLPC
jgi:hypothetical protein